MANKLHQHSGVECAECDKVPRRCTFKHTKKPGEHTYNNPLGVWNVSSNRFESATTFQGKYTAKCADDCPVFG